LISSLSEPNGWTEMFSPALLKAPLPVAVPSATYSR
jgi:hypothetical protein